MTLRPLAVALTAAALVLTGCGADDPDPASSPSATITVPGNEDPCVLVDGQWIEEDDGEPCEADGVTVKLPKHPKAASTRTTARPAPAADPAPRQDSASRRVITRKS